MPGQINVAIQPQRDVKKGVNKRGISILLNRKWYHWRFDVTIMAQCPTNCSGRWHLSCFMQLWLLFFLFWKNERWAAIGFSCFFSLSLCDILKKVVLAYTSFNTILTKLKIFPTNWDFIVNADIQQLEIIMISSPQVHFVASSISYEHHRYKAPLSQAQLTVHFSELV